MKALYGWLEDRPVLCGLAGVTALSLLFWGCVAVAVVFA